MLRYCCSSCSVSLLYVFNSLSYTNLLLHLHSIIYLVSEISPIFFALSKGYVHPTHKCFSRRTFWNGQNIFICMFLILLVCIIQYFYSGISSNIFFVWNLMLFSSLNLIANLGNSSLSFADKSQLISVCILIYSSKLTGITNSK